MDLSVQEENCVRLSLVTRAIPSPKLLIKDHKTISYKGGFPTRLVIPASNFTAKFSKIGYLGIKKMLYKVRVNDPRVSIVQASDLKETLEELKVNRDEMKIESFDAINMYPSIKLSKIKRQ